MHIHFRCQIECAPKYVGCPLLDGTEVIEQPTVLPTLTEKYTQRAKEVIKDGSSTKQPFFLYMAYGHTHHPQFAGANFRNTTLRGEFGDALAEMDHSIGAIISSVHQLGIENNTFIFFTSDNG